MSIVVRSVVRPIGAPRPLGGFAREEIGPKRTAEGDVIMCDKFKSITNLNQMRDYQPFYPLKVMMKRNAYGPISNEELKLDYQGEWFTNKPSVKEYLQMFHENGGEFVVKQGRNRALHAVGHTVEVLQNVVDQVLLVKYKHQWRGTHSKQRFKIPSAQTTHKSFERVEGIPYRDDMKESLAFTRDDGTRFTLTVDEFAPMNITHDMLEIDDSNGQVVAVVLKEMQESPLTEAQKNAYNSFAETTRGLNASAARKENLPRIETGNEIRIPIDVLDEHSYLYEQERFEWTNIAPKDAEGNYIAAVRGPRLDRNGRVEQPQIIEIRRKLRDFKESKYSELLETVITNETHAAEQARLAEEQARYAAEQARRADAEAQRAADQLRRVERLQNAISAMDKNRRFTSGFQKLTSKEALTEEEKRAMKNAFDKLLAFA